MEKTYLAIVVVLALATAAALTPLAISQQVFAQDTERGYQDQGLQGEYS